MDIQIELVKAGDVATIEEVVTMTDIFKEESRIYSTLDFNRDKFRDYVTSFTQDPCALVVAKIDNKVVGYSLVFLDTMYIDKINCEIVTIYVPPAFRNSGVGSKIVDALDLIIEQSQAAYSQVSVCAFFKEGHELIQRATERLFKRKGFEQIGVILGKKGA